MEGSMVVKMAEHNVLIIDDDKELCVLIKRSLLAENIEADFCNTGKEGLAKLKEKEILESGDLVVVSGGAKLLNSEANSKVACGIVKI